jgi:hypothetical protein
MPRLNRLRAGSLLNEIILIFCDTKYKRSARGKRFSSSIASQVLQQCKSGRKIRKKLSRPGTFVPTFDASAHDAGRSHVDQGGFQSAWQGVERFQSACKMQYDAGVRRPTAPMRVTPAF